MKNYLKFSLKGEDIFSYFIIIVIICMVPAIIFSIESNAYLYEDISFWRGFLFAIIGLGILAAVLILALYIIKMVIESIEYDSEKFKFSGEAGEYVGLILKGVLLTLVTLGIYFPFFQRELTAFYMAKSSYRDESFAFQGKGVDLLVIFLLAFILPMVILSLIFGFDFGSKGIFSSFKAYGINIFQTVVMAPFAFLYYRWFIDAKYKQFHARIDTDLVEGIGVVLLQTVLIAATFGIYFPVGTLKIYQYYLEKLKVKDESGLDQKIKFGYDMDVTNDFLYIWGQTLLTLITLTIYGPWAYCNVLNRVLGKTWVETVE